jgi:hypothetical protein
LRLKGIIQFRIVIIPNIYVKSEFHTFNLRNPRRMRWVWQVAHMGEKTNACRILVEKPEGKTALGISRKKVEDHIKMDLTKIGCGGMNWVDLAQDRD